MRRTPRTLLASLAAACSAALLWTVAPLGAPASEAATPPRDGKAVILNLFQWTWDSVATECTETIGPAGFGYVQVSPPQEHVPGTQWWTSYQPVSYQIESKLGTRAEFAAMVDACDAAGVGIIADAVINHMAGADSSGHGVAGTPYAVDHFPGVPFSAGDFNDCRSDISNYSDRWEVQNCRLVSLQDLRTSSTYVQDRIADYLDDLVSLGVDGFRIDASKHIPAGDLEAIKARMTNSDVYWVHEVIGAAGEPIQPAEYLGSGDSHEFDYARELKHRFDGQIKDLRYIGDGKLPSDRAGVFVDNHDTERNGETMTYQWGAKYVLGNVFLLSWPYGSPTVYSGYQFSGYDTGVPGSTTHTVPDAECGSGVWLCTQRWTEVRGMVGFHNTVGDAPVTRWWDDGSNHIGYGRGDLGYVTINNSGNAVSRTYATDLPAGEYCDVVAADDCSVTVQVAGDGTFTATTPAYGALALHVGATAGPSSSPSPTPTSGPGQEDVSIAVQAQTTWGQNVYLVGDHPALGSWNPYNGVALSADSYPVWTGTVDVPAGTTVEYKYVKIDGGNVVWESGSNRTVTVGPDGSATLNDTWRS